MSLPVASKQLEVSGEYEKVGREAANWQLYYSSNLYKQFLASPDNSHFWHLGPISCQRLK